jgi:hypothetical protein
MIVEIWQYHDNPDHLVMCLEVWDDFKNEKVLEVVNGFYHLTEDRKKKYKAKFLGLIDWPWLNEYQNEDYHVTLQRFQNGERAEYVVCQCCDVGSWRNEKGEKIKKPDPKDYPTDWGVNND